MVDISAFILHTVTSSFICPSRCDDVYHYLKCHLILLLPPSTCQFASIFHVFFPEIIHTVRLAVNPIRLQCEPHYGLSAIQFLTLDIWIVKRNAKGGGCSAVKSQT